MSRGSDAEWTTYSYQPNIHQRRSCWIANIAIKEDLGERASNTILRMEVEYEFSDSSKYSRKCTHLNTHTYPYTYTVKWKLSSQVSSSVWMYDCSEGPSNGAPASYSRVSSIRLAEIRPFKRHYKHMPKDDLLLVSMFLSMAWLIMPCSCVGLKAK